MIRQVIFAAALLVSGCGGGPDFACDQVVKSGTLTQHACSEFNNLDSAQIDAAAKACLDNSGTEVDSCSLDGDLGVCTINESGFTIEVRFYPDGGITAAIAEAGCQQQLHGTWTAS